MRYLRPRIGPWMQLFDLAGYEWNTLELSLPHLPPALDGASVIHLSDLHLRSRWPGQFDRIIERINAARPELILFTGDFVDDKRDHRPALPLVKRLITSLRPAAGFYAVLGNHDGDLFGPRLHALGVRLITHQRIDVPVRGEAIELIGMPGPDRLDLDERFIPSLPPPRTGVPRIVLSHYPDLVRTARPLHADLFLAGHTHGGQMCLPNERALITHDSLPRRMCKGPHDIDGTCLLVSRGLGFTTLPIRLFCPAEVLEIKWKRASADES